MIAVRAMTLPVARAAVAGCRDRRMATDRMTARIGTPVGAGSIAPGRDRRRVGLPESFLTGVPLAGHPLQRRRRARPRGDDPRCEHHQRQRDGSR